MDTIFALVGLAAILGVAIGIISLFYPLRGLGIRSRGRALLVVIVSTVIIGICGSNSERQVADGGPAQIVDAPKQQAAAATKTAQAPMLKTSAMEISAAYEGNTIAADQRFKGKTFQVSGIVTDINTDLFGSPYLVMAGTNQFLGPQFKFDKKWMDQLAQIHKGSPVTVICTGAGDVMKAPMSDNCQLTN